MKKTFQFIFLTFLCFFVSHKVQAADFYVDPMLGSMSNDGTQAHPWSTMQEVWEQGKIRTGVWSGYPNIAVKNPDGSVHTGDTIYLLSGYHGTLTMVGAVNDDWITIKAAEGATPEFHNISIDHGAKWIFDGISISYTYGPDPIAKPSPVSALFYVTSHNFFGRSRDITLKNSTLFSYMDNSRWTTMQDWLDNTVSGVFTYYSEYITIDNCNFYNTSFAIAFLGGQHEEIKNNFINWVSGDAIRMGGTSYSKIEYNIVKNLYLVDANHPDLIQGWALADSAEPDWMDYGGQSPQKGLEIRGNTLISNDSPGQLFAADAQGIGMYDGFYEDFIIENNLIVSPTTHGITLTGAINCKIINNTVVSNPLGNVSSPIRVLPHKNRTEGYGNIVRNNICSAIGDHSLFTNPAEKIYGGVTADHNIKNLTSAMSYDLFVNPGDFNYRLKSTAVSAIDAGSADLSPTIDLNKYPRDASPDIGAYEYAQIIRANVDNSSSITTSDALLTLRKSVGLSMDGTAWQASATTGDVNCDSVTNSADALLILRYSVGLSMGSTAWCEG